MEDFATFCKNMPKEQNSPKRRSVKPANTKKTKWLSKTIFWNLFFWFGMSAGFTAASFTRFTLHNDTLASVIMWLTIIGVFLITTLANKTRFIKENTFANSENIILTKKQLPTGNFILFTVVAMLATGYFVPNNSAKQVLTAFPSFLALFSGFSLYFIFKNCPISILFNRKFIGYLNDNAPVKTKARNPNTDPSYSFFSTNIFYKHRNR